MRNVERAPYLVLMGLAALASAAMGAASFEEAKRKADSDEGTLPPSQLSTLAQVQGAVVGEAFSSCMPRPAPQPLPTFVVVMELNAEGRVLRTWSRGDSAIASCMERAFSRAMAFRPPRAPFFTSFDFKQR